MTNMFSGNEEKKIPKDLKSCYKTDNVTHNLWIWCERLEKWGKILFWFLIISGVIMAITSAIVMEEVTKGSYYQYTETETSFNFVLFFSSLLETAIYAFLEYCAYHVLALLVGSLATIVQHTKITANIALYNSAKAEGVTDDCEKEEKKPSISDLQKEQFIKENTNQEERTWMCPECCRKNKFDTAICDCGYQKK